MEIWIFAHEFNNPAGRDLALRISGPRLFSNIGAYLRPEWLRVAEECQVGAGLEHLFQTRQAKLVITSIIAANGRRYVECQRQADLFDLFEYIHVIRIVKSQIRHIFTHTFAAQVFIVFQKRDKVCFRTVVQESRVKIQEWDKTVRIVCARFQYLVCRGLRACAFGRDHGKNNGLVNAIFVQLGN